MNRVRIHSGRPILIGDWFISGKLLAEEYKEELQKAEKVEKEYMDTLKEYEVRSNLSIYFCSYLN